MNRTLEKVILGSALAAGIGACAVSRSVRTHGGTTSYIAECKDVNAYYYTRDTATNAVGCSLFVIDKNTGEFQLFDDYNCDDKADFFLEWNNDDRFMRDRVGDERFFEEQIDPLFSKTKYEVMGGERK